MPALTWTSARLWQPPCWATPPRSSTSTPDSNDRFTLVKTGEIDVLFRNSTWTTTRDSAEVGMEFMPVNFYDGQGMMVRKDSGIKTIEDMDGATICVQSGTTTELNLADYFRPRGLEFAPVVFDDNDKTLAAYDEGRCDGFTTDKSGLVASLTKMTGAGRPHDPGRHDVQGAAGRRRARRVTRPGPTPCAGSSLA